MEEGKKKIEAPPGILVRSVSVKYGRKVNMGNFESATYEVVVWADIDTEEQPELDLAMHALWAMAKQNIKAQALPVMLNKPNLDMRNYFMGLPVIETGAGAVDEDKVPLEDFPE